MRLYLVAFGKLRTPGLRAATDYYLKMLGGFTKVEEVELRPETVENKSPSERERVRAKEAELLTTKLDSLLGSRGRFYLLDETGKAKPTSEWASLVQDCEDNGATEAAFCIGGSLGFSSELRRRASGVLSLGPQTLSHELARAVLAEQLYRAWSVRRGHPYHND